MIDSELIQLTTLCGIYTSYFVAVPRGPQINCCVTGPATKAMLRSASRQLLSKLPPSTTFRSHTILRSADRMDELVALIRDGRVPDRSEEFRKASAEAKETLKNVSQR